MKTWMVYITVKACTEGRSLLIARWLDSQWAKKEAADARHSEIVGSMRHFDCYRVPGSSIGAAPEIVVGEVVDVAIVDDKKAAEPEIAQ